MDANDPLEDMSCAMITTQFDAREARRMQCKAGGSNPTDACFVQVPKGSLRIPPISSSSLDPSFKSRRFNCQRGAHFDM